MRCWWKGERGRKEEKRRTCAHKGQRVAGRVKDIYSTAGDPQSIQVLFTIRRRKNEKKLKFGGGKEEKKENYLVKAN